MVDVTTAGYGGALMGGIEATRGRFVIMGDADDSYDFLELFSFVQKLREGFDLVLACRLPAGGGEVLSGAMPPLHRWLGNPFFTALARRWFGAPIHDVYCGMRGFTRAHYDSFAQRCTGMEFATEMVIKSSLSGAAIAEVPIKLNPDRRTSHAPHLRTFRDGWRTLRFVLGYRPRWLFQLPGTILILFGLLAYAVPLPGLHFAGVTFDVHTLLFGSLAILLGCEAVVFGLCTKTFAIAERLIPEDEGLKRFYARFNLEKGLALGTTALVIGCTMLLIAMNVWRLSHFGRLDYAHTLRIVITGATLTALGFQTILSSFFASILGMRRR